MKRRIITVALMVLLGAGCADELDGEYVKDTKGNIYQLDWRIGGLYAPLKIDIDKARLHLDLYEGEDN